MWCKQYCDRRGHGDWRFGDGGCDMVEKKNDYNHVNMAELDAVLKGINLAIKWGLREIEIWTDSATVLSWVTSTVEESGRIRTKGAGEVIVKRRLGILGELTSEFKLQIRAVFVPSERNKADVLTRIKKTVVSWERRGSSMLSRNWRTRRVAWEGKEHYIWCRKLIHI